MTTWGDVYLDVCKILLEDGGLTLGLFQANDFYRFAGEVLTDFLTKTGMIKKLINLPTQAGVTTYTIPDQVSDTQAGAYDQNYLQKTSAFYLDNSDPYWQSINGDPTTWKQDELGTKQISLNPNPAYQGNQVVIPLGQGLYGTISSTSNAVDFDFTATASGLYGTISGYTGNPYLEVTAPMFGVIASMVGSVNNLSLVSTAIPFLISGLKSTTYIELVPDSMVQYLKDGVLARIWALDGDAKDLQKSYYAQTRYAEGVNMMSTIMQEEYMEA